MFKMQVFFVLCKGSQPEEAANTNSDHNYNFHINPSRISSRRFSLLSLHGIEDLLDGWHTRDQLPGIMNDIFDGRVARNVRGPDGLPFFHHDEAGKTGLGGELRIGLTLGADCPAP